LQPKKAADVTEVEDESGETERRVGREGEIVWGVCRLFASFNDTFIVRCLSALRSAPAGAQPCWHCLLLRRSVPTRLALRDATFILARGHDPLNSTRIFLPRSTSRISPAARPCAATPVAPR